MRRHEQVKEQRTDEESSRHSRVYLSIGHLKNAAHFVRLTSKIERYTGFVWGTIKPHEAYAMGTVLSSVT